jgi:YHS domain-containing protein
MRLQCCAWIPGLVILAGCGITMETRPLPAGHPASAEAAERPYVSPTNLLSGDLPAQAPKEGGSDEHRPHEHGPGAATAAPKPYPLNVCLVGGEELGKMGKPEVMTYQGREIKFCCAACIATFKKDPAKYLKMLDEADKKEKPKEKKPDPHGEHEEKK